MKYAFHAYIRQAPPERFEELAMDFAMDVMQPNAEAKLRLQTGHIDFLRITPEETTIKVLQIRDCISALSARPYEGGKRVVVIFHADKMTSQAQNCLLKTLEEPPSGTSFLLLTDRPSDLLPTIRSRCATLPPLFTNADNGNAASALLASLQKSESMDVAATLPQGRSDLFNRCTALLDDLDTLIQTSAAKGEETLLRYSRYVALVHHAQQMIEHNVNTALCAQWLCIQLKEDNHDNRCWS